MASSINLKNSGGSTLAITHSDSKGGKTIIGTDIVTSVATINDFPTVGIQDGDTVIVKDANRGGTFIYRSADVATNNGGTIFNGWCRQYEGAVNVKWFGVSTGSNISTQLQLILDEHDNVYIPSGVYTVNNTVIVRANTKLFGAAPRANINTEGTVFDFQSNSDLVCFMIHDTGAILEDFRVINSNVANQLTSAIETPASGGANTAFSFSIKNIMVNGYFDKAFNIVYSWHFILEKCRVEGGKHDYGFYIPNGTSSKIDACLSYGSKVFGFYLQKLTYCTMNSCGVDGGAGGLHLAGGNRGLTVNSFGVESTSSGENLLLEGSNNSLTINSPTLSSNSSVDADIIKINTTGNSVTTINGLNLPSAYTPNIGFKMLNIIDDGDGVTLITPSMFGTQIGDVDSCNIIGGNIVNRGSNANGSYLKNYDGTLICHFTSEALSTTSLTQGTLFRSTSTLLTFPYAFVGDFPEVSQSPVSNSGAPFAPAAGAITLTTANLRLLGTTATDSGYISYIAIGRWK